MTTTLPARSLTLKEVHRLLAYQPIYNGIFTSWLSLSDLTATEQQTLAEIVDNLLAYLPENKLSEGQVKALAVTPLLQLAGFYQQPIGILVEENIDRIEVEDEDTMITGRFDLIAINRTRINRNDIYFCILVIESKNSSLAPIVGLPQLLTYAYPCLKNQSNVWGLVTNGMLYQFLYIENGTSPTYQYMPLLNLQETHGSIQLLQVLKAIRQL